VTGLDEGRQGPLFRSAAGRTGTLTERPMNRVDRRPADDPAPRGGLQAMVIFAVARNHAHG
jgi:hypothetical protein